MKIEEGRAFGKFQEHPVGNKFCFFKKQDFFVCLLDFTGSKMYTFTNLLHQEEISKLKKKKKKKKKIKQKMMKKNFFHT